MAAASDELISKSGADPDAPASHEVREQGLVFMVFRVGALWYGVSATNVRQVVSLSEAVPVPGTPLFVRGIINVTGQLVTLFDLTLLLGVGAGGNSADDVTGRCLLLESAGAVVAIGVDEVSGLTEVPKTDVHPARGAGPSDAANEVFTRGERHVTLLHVGRLIELAESKVQGSSSWRS
jgi:purine-binding chemotaxis protein CheW